MQGNPGKRPLNENEPAPEIACPDPPAYLSPAAAKHWEKVAPQLAGLGLMSEIDVDALALYCESFATWIDAQEKLQEFGLVVTSPKSGYPVPSPFFSIAAKAQEQMRQLLTEFGMSPSSRSRLAPERVPPKKPRHSKETEARRLFD